MDDPLVTATAALALATGLLVITTWLQGRAQTRRADAEVGVLKEQAAALAASAAALADSAKATQAMADEMLEVRKAEQPLDLEVGLEDGTGAGVFSAGVWRTSGTGVVITRTELLAGKERLPAAQPTIHGNLYLGGKSNRYFVNEPYDRHGRDLVVLRVTGIPENGVEQSREFLYRVLPSGGLERLTGDEVEFFAGDGPVSGNA